MEKHLEQSTSQKLNHKHSSQNILVQQSVFSVENKNLSAQKAKKTTASSG